MSVDLVVVAGSWCGLPSAVHHLMPYVALDRQILWVDASVLDTGRETSASARGGAGGCLDAAPFEVISTLPPLPRVRHLACVTDAEHAVRQVAAAARRAGICRPVLWLAAAAGRRLIGQFDEQAVVYHHLDGVPPGDGDAGAALAECADLIVTGSRSAAAAFPPGKVRVLADGVSPELFETPMQPAPALPSGQPVAGFHGRIDRSFDAALLAGVARRLPHWQFMLIGPVADDAPTLPDMPNIAVLGPRPHPELPRYSQYWTAAMLLRRRPLTDRLPQQLREYLAAGAPIVGHADGLPHGLRHLVAAAGGVDAFVAGLEAALGESREWRKRRRRALQGEVWPARAAEVAVMLDDLVPPARPLACGRGRVQQARL